MLAVRASGSKFSNVCFTTSVSFRVVENLYYPLTHFDTFDTFDTLILFTEKLYNNSGEKKEHKSRELFVNAK